MRHYITRMVSVLCMCFIPVFANASFYSDGGQSCYTDDYGCDEFWYCGKPLNDNHKCADNRPWGCDDEYRYNHGDSFSHGDSKYWCCNGTTSKSGQFKEGDKWIKETKSVKETLTAGTCTWIQKINICGQVDNPGDKSTEATGECTTGFVSHNGKCVAACAEGQAFASSTSNACVECEPSYKQGVKKGVCIKCESNQFFDNNTLSCVARSSKLQVSSNAFNDCWMCSTPGAMYNCMKLVSNGGDLNSNSALHAACSINSKSMNTSEFKLPDTSIKIKLLPVDLKMLKKVDSVTLKKKTFE